ncbi:MAG: rod shape-determining protein MreC [Sphingomonadales bacterium]|nr:rod shape-determining protein MreC [Sphingomonadales bacterium]
MPPPVNRRSGYSRRALFGTFMAYVAGVAGVLLGAGLLVVHSFEPTLFSGLRGALADAGTPAARLAADGRATTGDLFAVMRGYLASGIETARLEREVALARVLLAHDAALAEENRQLKTQLHLADENPHIIAHGWLIAGTDSSIRRYATISAGSDDAVKSGMPVVTPLGLVGRVLETGRHSARVLLLDDGESVVPVRRASDGLPAFATGRPDGQLQLRLITLGLNPLHAGDAFVTSGSGGLFWPNTPVAVVTTLTRDGALARVLASPATASAVGVETVWNPVADPSLPAPAVTAQRARAKR